MKVKFTNSSSVTEFYPQEAKKHRSRNNVDEPVVSTVSYAPQRRLDTGKREDSKNNERVFVHSGTIRYYIESTKSAFIHTVAARSFTIISIYLLFRSMSSDKEENTISFFVTLNGSFCAGEAFVASRALIVPA